MSKNNLTNDERAQFETLPKLQKNWDSYGSPSIDPECIGIAQRMLMDLRRAGWAPPWSIVPCSNGGVQIEQHAYGLDIEICIDKSTHTTAK